MEKHKSNLFKISMAVTTLLATSNNAYAVLCTGGACSSLFAVCASSSSEYSFDCPEEKGVAEFDNDALEYIEQFETDIETAGKEIADAILETSSTEIKTIVNGNENLIKTMVTISNSKLKDELKRDKMMLDMKMDYISELNERETKAKQSVISMDDTREEALFIISELKNVGNGNATDGYNHAHEVIAAMKQKYDSDPDFMIPVRIKSAEATMGEGEGCPDYDPELHKAGQLPTECFYGVKSSPGAKLEKYFQECSRIKRESLTVIQKNVTTKATQKRQLNAQSSFQRSSQTKSSNQMQEAKTSQQMETSCQPTEFGYNMCGIKEDGTKITSTEYITKVIDNEIVPYGNVSSSNYLAPVPIGSIDGDLGDIDPAELKAMQITAQQEKTASGEVVEPTVAMSSNTPPLDKTYRTSSQYFAAEDFVNNIINKEAVSDIRIEDSQNSDKALFKSKYMARTASLSLAEYSLRQPIEKRMGSKMAAAIQEGSITRDSYITEDGTEQDFLKEDINGAAEIDRLAFAINKDYERISADSLKGVETAPIGSLSEYQIEALVRMNQLLLKENESNERIELLLAAMLANMANSKDNIDYINNLKYK